MPFGVLGSTTYEAIVWRSGGGSERPHLAVRGPYNWATCCGEFVKPEKVIVVGPASIRRIHNFGWNGCRTCIRIYRDREARAKEAANAQSDE